MLHETPDQVNKFHQDINRIGRPGSGGVMEYVAIFHVSFIKIPTGLVGQVLMESWNM
jgi:hypothetical protein